MHINKSYTSSLTLPFVSNIQYTSNNVTSAASVHSKLFAFKVTMAQHETFLLNRSHFYLLSNPIIIGRPQTTFSTLPTNTGVKTQVTPLIHHPNPNTGCLGSISGQPYVPPKLTQFTLTNMGPGGTATSISAPSTARSETAGGRSGGARTRVCIVTGAVPTSVTAPCSATSESVQASSGSAEACSGSASLPRGRKRRHEAKDDKDKPVEPDCLISSDVNVDDSLFGGEVLLQDDIFGGAQAMVFDNEPLIDIDLETLVDMLDNQDEDEDV